MPESKEWESHNWKWKNPNERSKKLFVGNVTERKLDDYLKQHNLSIKEGKKFLTRKRLPEFDKTQPPKTSKILTPKVPEKPKDMNNKIDDAKRESDQAHADYQNIRSKYRKYTKANEKLNPKREESAQERHEATQMNEDRAVKLGKIKPPTPKHLVDPKWKSWLEKAKVKKLSIGDKLRLGQDDFDRKEYDKKIVDVNMFGIPQRMPKEDKKVETAVSEEEPLEELTDGELKEVEKLKKSWEIWLETRKDALDPKAKPQSDLYGDPNTATVRNTRIGQKPLGVIDAGETHIDYNMPDRMIGGDKKLQRLSPKGIESERKRLMNRRGGMKDDNSVTRDDIRGARDDRASRHPKWKSWLEKTSNQEQTQEKILRDDHGKDTLPKNYKGMAYGMSKVARGRKGKLIQPPHRPTMSEGDKGVENKLTPLQTKRQSDSLVYQMLHDPEEFKKRIEIPTDSKPKDIEMEQEKESKETEAKIQVKDEPEWAKRVRRLGGKPIIRKKKKSWEELVEKDSAGQGDARYGNPHETGMEDPRKLQVTQDDFNMEENDDDNKPFIQRETRTDKDDKEDEQSK